MKKINAKSEKQKEFAKKMRDKAIKEREDVIERKSGVVNMLKNKGKYEGGRTQAHIQHEKAEIKWIKNCSESKALIQIGKGKSQVAHFSNEIDFYEN